MTQNVLFGILFVAVAVGAYLFYKHTHNKAIHKSPTNGATTPVNSTAPKDNPNPKA